ncbi:MAG: hypothetical protein GY854_00610 [Deltaproteobacteria bacterium]|nr:hypothetical protein [Deltaproteobacteria bacterium]
MIHCKKETSLTEAEKDVFTGHLERHGLDKNVWDLYGEWVERSTAQVSFLYLKVYADNDLIGLGLFLRVKPFDLRSSYSRLRGTKTSNKIGALISKVSSNCVYVAFRNLVTSNHTRPFFFREPELEPPAMQAMLEYLKKEKEADMVTVVDTSINSNEYQQAGFASYPSSSEAWFDVTKYQDISEYLAMHRSLRKNLARRKNRIQTEVRQGALNADELQQIKNCVACSVENSRVSNPCQKFFEDNIFSTEVFNSDKYIFFLIRVDGVIAGFHVFQVSNASFGGVLGGFNREHSRNNFLYERVIVASLDYAIKNKLRRVHYSLVDNYTKLRLVDLLEPCGLYFYSRNPMNRAVFKHTFKYNDVYALSLLEKQD